MARADTTGGRLHGFDALRGGLLLLGVVLHASGPFVPYEHVFALEDTHRDITISVLMFVIHIFRMTAFFVLAGLFARMSVHRLGANRFALDRLRRIALPLVVGWFAIMPLTLWISTWTIVHSYGPEGLQTDLAPPRTIDLNNAPLQHFWFLYVLLLLYVIVVTARWVVKKVDPDYRISNRVHHFARRVLSTPFGLLLLAAPATLLLGEMPGWTVVAGVPTPNMGLFHVVRPLIVYGVAFAIGWAMHRQLDLAPTWTRWWPCTLAMAIAFTLLSLWLSLVYPLGIAAPDPLNSLMQAAVYSLAGWTWTFALIGIALRFLSGQSRVRRYLADASYWIYLTHPPLLLILGDAIRTLDWPAWPKLLVTVGVTTAILLVCYQLFVRYTIIGTTLNGKRVRPAKLVATRA